MEGMMETLEKERFRGAIQQAAGLTVSILGIAVLVGLVPGLGTKQMGFVAMTVFFSVTGIAYGFRMIVEAMDLGSSKSGEMTRWTAMYIAASIVDLEATMREMGGWDAIGRRTQIRIEKLFSELCRSLPDRALRKALTKEREGKNGGSTQDQVRTAIDSLLRLRS